MNACDREVLYSRLKEAAAAVVHEARVNRKLLRGTSLVVDDLEDALDRLAEDHDSPTNGGECEPAFYETLAWRFRNPEDRRAIEAIGEFLHRVANSEHLWGADDHRPLAFREVEAAAADLGHIVDYLERVGSTSEEAVLTDREFEACKAANGWAGRLARVQVDMHRTLQDLDRREEVETHG